VRFGEDLESVGKLGDLLVRKIELLLLSISIKLLSNSVEILQNIISITSHPQQHRPSQQHKSTSQSQLETRN
jgi:hypothetical protein